MLAEEGLVCDTSDAFLIKFLRAKKFDYESSFRYFSENKNRKLETNTFLDVREYIVNVEGKNFTFRSL